MRGKRLPQDVSLEKAARAVGVTAETWPELHAKAKAKGLVLLPAAGTQVIDLCEQGLCATDAEATVKVSAGEDSVTLKLCAKHLDYLRGRVVDANQEPGRPIDMVITPVRRVS